MTRERAKRIHFQVLFLMSIKPTWAFRRALDRRPDLVEARVRWVYESTHHVGHVGPAGRIAGHAFLIDDVGTERDAIGDVVVQVRMVRH